MKNKYPRCIICGSKERLEVHHSTYNRKGCEHNKPEKSLTVLCSECHYETHCIMEVD